MIIEHRFRGLTIFIVHSVYSIRGVNVYCVSEGHLDSANKLDISQRKWTYLLNEIRRFLFDQFGIEHFSSPLWFMIFNLHSIWIFCRKLNFFRNEFCSKWLAGYYLSSGHSICHYIIYMNYVTLTVLRINTSYRQS